MKEHIPIHGVAKAQQENDENLKKPENEKAEIVDANHTCNLCLQTFKSRTSLGMHMRHHPSRQNAKKEEAQFQPVEFVALNYPCSLCNRTFQNQLGLDVHNCERQKIDQSATDAEEGNDEQSEFVRVSYYFNFLLRMLKI